MTYSLDFHRKVFIVKDKANLTLTEVAKRFDIGLASVVRWSANIAPKNTRYRPTTKINMEALQQDIIDYPDAYQYERAHRLNVSKSGIWHALQRLKVTYKKNSNASQSGSRKTLCFLPNNPTLPR